MKKINIIVPCYNEQDCILPFYTTVSNVVEEIRDYEFSYLFVNDGSKDKTLKIIKELSESHSEVHYISFSRNFGKESAMYAGLEYADGDFVVLMDVDLQDDPKILPQMVEAMEEGYDCCATRRMDRKGEPVIRSCFAKCFYKLMNHFTEVEIVDGARDYRMMTRQMVDAILSVNERVRFSKGIFAWVGFDYKWLEYINIERQNGQTKWSFWSLLQYALSGIIAFSTAPLKWMMGLGGGISLVSLMFLLYKILKTAIIGVDVPGYASLVVLICFFGGIHLFAIGLVGLYLGNVYSESKQRPVYILKETDIKDK